MPKKRKLPPFFSAPVLCAAYPLAAFALIFVFRLFFPEDFFGGSPEPFLPIYRTGRSISAALLDWIALFPALALSALVLPLGMNPDYTPAEKSFSASFLNRIKPFIFTAMAASVIFALFTMLARPALMNYQSNMRNNSKVYQLSKENAEMYAEKEEWTMAMGFLSLCKKIWPEKNPSLAALDEKIRPGYEHFSRNRPLNTALPLTEKSMPGEKQPTNAAQAVEFANKALEEDRLYDAHWLANLAIRLSKAGSAEHSAGARVASWAWNRINMLEPTPGEQRLNSIYRQKRAGYEAMIAEDWIRAYYLFNELSLIVPEDGDVAKYLEMSQEGIKQVAFFIDEMNAATGDEIENALFSIPRMSDEGRIVIRARYLSALTGESYANTVDIAAFTGENEPDFRVETPFAKIMPLYVNGMWRSVILLRAIDRDDDRVHWDPLWTGGTGDKTGEYQILLDISYEDFLLAAEGTSEISSFYLADFWAAAKHLEHYGYAPEVFQSEIIRILARPLIFLPLAIFSIVIGWRFRARHRPGFSCILMIATLPFVFSALVSLIFMNLENLYIVMILSLGFVTALVCTIALAVFLLIISLLRLAAQHS